MLKRISIERFKSIRRADLDLGRVNLFIGGNGSGKSNLLEAIGVVSAALARGVSDVDLTSKGVRLTPPELMKSAFKGADLPRTLKISVTLSHRITYQMHVTASPDEPLLGFFSENCKHAGNSVFGRSNAGATALGQRTAASLDRHRGMWDQVRTAFKFSSDVRSALDALSDYVIYTPQTDFLGGVQSGRLDVPPVGLRGEGLPTAVRGVLAQRRLLERRKTEGRKRKLAMKRRALQLAFLPGWARRFQAGRLDEFLTSRGVQNREADMVYFIDKFMHGRRNKLSAYDSSEGTLFLLFAAVVLAHDEAPRTFGFDNVDSALNPRTARRLVEEITETTCMNTAHDVGFGPRQVFLTSHHPSTLDAFDLFDPLQRIFVVRRDDAGRTTIDRVQPRENMTREDWDIATNGRRLSQLWMDGEITGALGHG